MEKFTGVRKEGRGYYVAWSNGEIAGSASNPVAAQEKFAKEVARAQMNAERDAANAAWEAKRAAQAEARVDSILNRIARIDAQIEYSKSQAQLETICPNFYAM